MSKPKRTPHGWWDPPRGIITHEDEVPTLFAREGFTSLTILEHIECVTLEFGQEGDQPPTIGQVVMSHQGYEQLVGAIARELLGHGRRGLHDELKRLKQEGEFRRISTASKKEDP